MMRIRVWVLAVTLGLGWLAWLAMDLTHNADRILHPTTTATALAATAAVADSVYRATTPSPGCETHRLDMTTGQIVIFVPVSAVVYQLNPSPDVDLYIETSNSSNSSSSRTIMVDGDLVTVQPVLPLGVEKVLPGIQVLPVISGNHRLFSIAYDRIVSGEIVETVLKPYNAVEIVVCPAF